MVSWLSCNRRHDKGEQGKVLAGVGGTKPAGLEAAGPQSEEMLADAPGGVPGRELLGARAYRKRTCTSKTLASICHSGQPSLLCPGCLIIMSRL